MTLVNQQLYNVFFYGPLAFMK